MARLQEEEPDEQTEATTALARLGRSIREKEAAKVYQFPFWPEPERGVPNELIRSALFAAVHSKSRRHVRAEKIAAQGPYTIEFTGLQLTQAHLDVFEGVMHIARGTHEGNQVKFSAHRLLANSTPPLRNHEHLLPHARRRRGARRPRQNEAVRHIFHPRRAQRQQAPRRTLQLQIPR